MASGDHVVKILQISPSDTDPARIAEISGGSTPKETMIGYAFDDTTVQYLGFLCFLSGYDGGGLSLKIVWRPLTFVAAKVVQWEAAVRRVADDAEDFSASHSYDYNIHSDAVPSAAGEWGYSTGITFTDGADMDSWADGETAIIRVRRNPPATDDLVGDAILIGMIGAET
jgi:hypothetical protein